jgi:hypothetical protein
MVQQAIERYKTDHGEYPPYLLGGDIDGWQTWHARRDGVNDIDMGGGRVASNAKVVDPLIEDGYLLSYPPNAYVGDGQIIIRMTNAEGKDQQGDGDPRFGYKGNCMAMVLDDPNFFNGSMRPGPYKWSQIETRRTLDHGDWMNVPSAFKNSGTNMYYLGGGFRSQGTSPDVDVTSIYRPGNFFYRAVPEVVTSQQGFTLPPPNTNPGGAYTHYILGGYGAMNGLSGIDVIRLEQTDPDGNALAWRLPATYTSGPLYCGYGHFDNQGGNSGGLPEVFGGGDATTGPAWPYYREGASGPDLIYGAPDGVPDGVIIVLRDGSERGMEFPDPK